MELRVGDLVQCRDIHYNRGLGLVDRVGMVAELRRRDLRILFDVDNQGIWLSKQGVNRVTLPPTDRPRLLDRLTWLVHFVSAEELELELDEEGRYRYTVVCGELRLGELEEVRRYMEPLFVDLVVQPRGMSRLGLRVTFRRESAAT